MASKAELRALITKARRAMDGADVRSSSLVIQARLRALEVVQKAESILLYVSVGKEVQTRALIDEFQKQGKRVTVPAFLGDGLEARKIEMDCRWSTGAFGVPVPSASSPWAAPIDVCVTPGLAFSLRCDRLGFGFGHWDRFLSTCRVGMVIGICHDWQIVESLPVECTDRPADLVITERRIVAHSCTA